MKHMGLVMIAVLSISSFAGAQTMTKPKPAVRVGEPVEIKPGMAVRSGQQPGANTAKSLEAFKSSVSAAAVTASNQNKPAEKVACSPEQFASDLSRGTRYTKEDAAYVLGLRIITQGNCGGAEGAAGYDAEARENLIGAALYVAANTNAKKVTEMSAAELAQLDTVWAKGLAEAKNKNAPADEQVSAASQVAVARQIKEACQLRN